MFISPRTFRNHIFRISKKLGAHGVIDVVRLLQETMQREDVSKLRFSPRGKEVFLLVRENLSNKLVAERLGMSVSGVKRHKEKMLLQNECKTILELIAKYNGTEGEKTAIKNV